MGNVVCVRFDPSSTEEEALADISNVRITGEDDFQENSRSQLVAVGTCGEGGLQKGAAVANAEMDKPLFPMSTANNDTSCLHFAMRLLHSFGCMPNWEWLGNQLPGAPMVSFSRILSG